MAEEGPTVILMVGVNGVGKTTTIAKLAHKYISEGKKVMMIAMLRFICCTFIIIISKKELELS